MSMVDFVNFDDAFISEPVGKLKIKESEYNLSGSICVVDQGQKLVSGYTNRSDMIRECGPYIVFGDHTRVIKFIDFSFVVGADGVRLYKAADGYDPEFLYFFLTSVLLPSDGYGRHSKYLKEIKVPKYDTATQGRISERIKAQLAEAEKAWQAVTEQLNEASKLADAIIFDSLNKRNIENHTLGDVLEEVKLGIGKDWVKYPVLGATRGGLAPAKEPPGKKPERYKPAFPGTVFYNPMRILIGSIAFVDDGDEPGITSPDYVVLKGREGVVDSRWFYYWLRSPLGKQCINSLARGAVRERMLFNRLAEGKITLPGYGIQKMASQALTELKPMRAALQHKLDEITLLPQKILARAFGG